MRPDELSKVLEMCYSFAKRAQEAGLILGFKNCDQTPDEAITVFEALNVPSWGLDWGVTCVIPPVINTGQAVGIDVV